MHRCAKASVRRLIVLLVLWLAAGPLHAATLEVGPGKAYSKPSLAAAAAHDGDTVLITAGTYAADVCYWSANNLTITGSGGFAHLASGGAVAGGKGIWVITGSNTTVENIEFSGAACPDLNGAGIRQEGAGLTVRGCYFHDNQDGILANAGATSDILIERCEFANNGAGDGYSHNLYIGNVRTLTFRYNYSHHAKVGHCLKSRARANYIIANRIMDESTGTSSYSVNLPDGGLSYLIGNLIQQGPNTQNPAIIAVAEESRSNSIQHLYLINNTIVNDGPSNCTFVAVHSATTLFRAENNLIVGTGTTFSTAPTTSAHNLITTGDPLLVNRGAYDYHLQAGSAARDAGADPGTAESQALLPTRQYVHPHSDQARTTIGSAVDIGAYEYAVASTPPTVVTPANGPSSPVSGSTAALHVLGGPAGSESGYTYTWSVVSAPAGGVASFSPNGTHAGRDTTITVNRVGSWTVQVDIADPTHGTSTISGPLTITVAATFTSINVSGPASVAPSATASFTAVARDQFAQPLTAPPTLTWTATGGSVNGTGLFTAGPVVGTARVTATSGATSGHADASITASGHAASGAAESSGGGCGLGGGIAAFGMALMLMSFARRLRA